MAKDPAFLFYPNDWIGGTMGMTFEEKGAYMELLMMQFNRGHMTSHMIGQTVGQIWDNIKDKFETDGDGKFFNRRLEEEKNKRKDYTQSRRNNKSGKNQYSKQKNLNGHMTTHMIPHMENENENILIYYKSENDFLNDWKKVRERVLNKTTNINKLTPDEERNFSDLKKEFTIDQFRQSIQGLFMQKEMFESNRLRPKHFLSDRNIEKYLDAYKNKTQLFENKTAKL